MVVSKGLLLHLTSGFDILQVTWDSYDEGHFLFQLSNMCGVDSDIYRMRCPLIYFYVVEWHLPHRVSHQFGVRQLWPTDPHPSGVDLHK
jgi:hypothetical protein